MNDDSDTRFLLPQDVGICTEDIEKYRLGGFHPVHLGDMFDDGRYRIVNKLGAGGFSTVWLARDEREKKWVALKIVSAEHSTSVGNKSGQADRATSSLQSISAGFVARHHRQFTFEGPNGHHLCLVLPVLGPSASDLSSGFTCRLRPWLARRVGYQATKAVADLHSQGLCHGDVTTANILFSLLEFDSLGEADVFRLFGPPVTGELETESGEPSGPEAPRYIVKTVDFLSSPSNVIGRDISLVDFDQCFPVSSPPENMLGTPLEFLAPEAAAGMTASPSSDVWALGCCLFRLRSGVGLFENPYQVTSPADLMRYIIQTLGDVPREWQQILWDVDGQPTKDPSKGEPLWKWEDERPLKNLVYKIWDEPEGRVVQSGRTWSEDEDWDKDRNKPFPTCFSNMVWKPTAIKVDNVYLYGYDGESDALVEALPRISEHEAGLLYDLLSKIFAYDPRRRLTAKEMLSHPWFHLEAHESK